jgi:Uma2 family endonuclease
MMQTVLESAVSSPASALPTTPEAFDAWVMQPENQSVDYEFFQGKAVAKVVSNAYSSIIGARVVRYVGAFVDDNNLGYVTGADGGYQIGDERYIPDAAFISRARQPEPPKAAYNPIPPDLAIEVKSPSDDIAAMTVKIVNYLQAGVAVWWFIPEHRMAQVFAPGQKPLILGIDDTLSGGSVLPGFSLPLRSIYKD